MDLLIEGFRSAIEELSEYKKDQSISNNTKNLIKRVYKDYKDQIFEHLEISPEPTVEIILERFKKKLEESIPQKIEMDKNIKLSFDRFYYKSFDYRSFKFKNYEKKNTNSKAFIKEAIRKNKLKLTSNNLNILKGGTETSEYYSSMNITIKENIMRNQTCATKGIPIIDDLNIENGKIRISNKELVKRHGLGDKCLRKLLPDLRFQTDNSLIFKVTIYVILYFIINSNYPDQAKIQELITFIFNNVYCVDLTNIIESMTNNKSATWKIKYLEVIEQIKVKKDSVNFESLLEISHILSLVKDFPRQENDQGRDEENSMHSIQSDSLIFNKAKTFKTFVCSSEDQACFLPVKNTPDVLLYCNEQFYVIFRYIFCVYERLSKLTESVQAEPTMLSSKSPTKGSRKDELNFLGKAKSSNSLDRLYSFLVIFQAVVQKKIDSSNIYEEMCRDILGNDSYFMFNFDKLLHSVIKIT